MRILGGKNLLANKICILSLVVYFCVGAEPTNLHNDNSPEEDDDSAAEQYMSKIQDDYQNGLVTIVKFFDSLNSSLWAIAENLKFISASINASFQNTNGKINALETGVAQKQQKLYDNLNEKINGLELARKKSTEQFLEKIAVLDKKLDKIPAASGPVAVPQGTTLRSPTIVSSGSVVVYQEITVRSSTTCGGLLEVAENSESTIRYPNGGNYADKDRCVWVLAPNIKFASYRIHIESASMEANYDGVIVYYWSSRVELQSVKIIEFDSWISIPAPYVIITFCSDGGGAGTGFQASILGVGLSSDSATYRPFWLKTSTKVFSSYEIMGSSNGTNDVFGVVVQPDRGKSLEVSLRSTNTGTDLIKIYDLPCQHNPALAPHYEFIGSGSGLNPSGIGGLKSNSEYPRLVIFHKKLGYGFTLSFK